MWIAAWQLLVARAMPCPLRTRAQWACACGICCLAQDTRLAGGASTIMATQRAGQLGLLAWRSCSKAGSGVLHTCSSSAGKQETALPGRLELPTLRLTASRSNQLSYGSFDAISQNKS